jgi:hypothetical protein
MRCFSPDYRNKKWAQCPLYLKPHMRPTTPEKGIKKRVGPVKKPTQGGLLLRSFLVEASKSKSGSGGWI